MSRVGEPDYIFCTFVEGAADDGEVLAQGEDEEEEIEFENEEEEEKEWSQMVAMASLC